MSLKKTAEVGPSASCVQFEVELYAKFFSLEASEYTMGCTRYLDIISRSAIAR